MNLTHFLAVLRARWVNAAIVFAAVLVAAVLYLVGPSGRYMTGQSITLDGGFLVS